MIRWHADAPDPELAAFLTGLSEIPGRLEDWELPAWDQAPAGCCASCHGGPLREGQKLCVYCRELRRLTGSVPFPLPVPDWRDDVDGGVPAPVNVLTRASSRHDAAVLARRRRRSACTCSGAPHMTWCPRHDPHRKDRMLVLAAVITVCALVALIASYPVTWPMAFPGALLFLMAAHAGAGRRS